MTHKIDRKLGRRIWNKVGGLLLAVGWWLRLLWLHTKLAGIIVVNQVLRLIAWTIGA